MRNRLTKLPHLTLIRSPTTTNRDEAALDAFIGKNTTSTTFALSNFCIDVGGSFVTFHR